MRLRNVLPCLLLWCFPLSAEAGALTDLARGWLKGRPWEQEKQELLRKGEPLREADFGFEEVPDEENFLLGHLFAPSIRSVRPFVMKKGDEFPIRQGFHIPPINWTLGIVGSEELRDPAEKEWLDGFLPLAEADLAERIRSQLPFNTPRLLAPLPAMSSIFGEMKSLAGASSWLIRNDRAGDALTCIRTGLRIARGFGHGDGLIPSLVSTAVGPLPQPAIWEGLCRGVWNEEQLRLLDEELAAVEFFRPAVKSFRWERCASLFHMERAFTEFRQWKQPQGGEATLYFELCRMVPRFAEENLVFYSRTMTAFIDSVVGSNDREPTADLELACRGPALPWKFLGQRMIPALSSIFGEGKAADSRNSLARWHIALQRHRLRKGRLPGSLEEIDAALRPVTPPIPNVPGLPNYEADGNGQGRLWFAEGTLEAKKDFNWHLQINPEPAVWPQ